MENEKSRLNEPIRLKGRAKSKHIQLAVSVSLVCLFVFNILENHTHTVVALWPTGRGPDALFFF